MNAHKTDLRTALIWSYNKSKEMCMVSARLRIYFPYFYIFRPAGHYNIFLNAFLPRGSGMSLCCSSGTDIQVWECLLALSEFRTNSINHIWTSNAVPTSISNRFSEVKTLRIWMGRWKPEEVNWSQSSQLLQTSPDRVLPNFLFKKKKKNWWRKGTVLL